MIAPICLYNLWGFCTKNITHISIIILLNFIEQLRHRCCKDGSNINPETYDTISLNINKSYNKVTDLRWLHREKDTAAFSQVELQLLWAHKRPHNCPLYCVSRISISLSFKKINLSTLPLIFSLLSGGGLLPLWQPLIVLRGVKESWIHASPLAWCSHV